MTKEQLKERMQDYIEWMETSEGDEVECISAENIEMILSEFFEEKFDLKLDV